GGETAEGAGRGEAPMTDPAPLAYFWGDDGYGLDAALAAFLADGSRFPAGRPDRWRPAGDASNPGRLIAELTERLATGSMFGAGIVAVVSGSGTLLRRG